MRAPLSRTWGHARQIAYLEKVLCNKTPAHAYVFSGHPLLGTEDIAREFLANLLDVTVPGLAHHPDLVLVTPPFDEASGKTRDISVEEIRDVTRRLGLRASSGRNVALILGAERMNMHAQNALLKTLEEPTPNTVIVLVANEVQKMLPTILSRAVHIPFHGVPREASEADLLRAETFVRAPASARMAQAVKETRGDDAAGGDERLRFVTAIARVLERDCRRGHGAAWHRGLGAALASREAMLANGNATLAFEHIALHL